MTICLINLVAAILLTTITGSVLVVVWLGIGILLEKAGFVNIVFELLKMVVFFFLFPMAYIILKVFEAEVGNGHLFRPTPAIVLVCKWFLVIWGIGACLILGYVLFDMYQISKFRKNIIQCDLKTQRMFDMLKESMDLGNSRLQIGQSYYVRIPCVSGIRKPMILIPVSEYSEEELRIILIHEMTHYKQKDIRLKYFTFVLFALHFYNPFACILFVQVQRWCEYACDYRSCSRLGEMNEYFMVILRVAIQNPVKAYLTSQLLEDQHELIGRIRKMKKIMNMGKRSRISAVIVLCIAFMTSSISVCAMTVESAEAYVAWESETQAEARVTEAAITSGVEASEDGELELFIDNGSTRAIAVMTGEVNYSARSTYGFEWKVPVGYILDTPYFDCKVGDTVGVTVMLDPTNVTCKTGIEYSNGTRYYIQGTNYLSYPFEITTAGKYRVFVENIGGADVIASGSYIIR